MNTVKKRVTVTRIFLERPSGTGTWLILDTDIGKATGTMSWVPKQGEKLLLTGTETAYQGAKQFKFTSATPDVPDNPRALLAYTCKLASGIGAATEEKIWEELGEDWQDIEEGDVKGVRGAKLNAFKDAMEYISEHAEQVKAVSFLMDKGATFKMAQSAWDAWGMELMGVINDNPYRLVELRGYGFSDVDRTIRKRFGIEDMDDRRVSSGVDYAVRVLTDTGSTVVDANALLLKALELLKLDNEYVFEKIAYMLATGQLVGFPEVSGIASRTDFDMEQSIWEFAK